MDFDTCSVQTIQNNKLVEMCQQCNLISSNLMHFGRNLSDADEFLSIANNDGNHENCLLTSESVYCVLDDTNARCTLLNE